MSLKSLIQDKQVSVSIVFSEDATTEARDYIICGEESTVLVVLDFNYILDATQELAKSIFARVESYMIELDSDDRPSSLLNMQRMRSVESLTSLSEKEDEDTLSGNSLHGRTNAVYVSARRIIIPVRTVIESEVSFEKAKVRLSISLFEERVDDSLRRFLDEPRIGAKMLRELLSEEITGTPAEKPLITEFLTTVNQSIPLYRPLQAEIRFVRNSDDSAFISVQLSCNEALKEVFTVKELSLSIGDTASHTLRSHDGMLKKSIFKVEPYAVPLPVTLEPGEIFACIFVSTKMPFAEHLIQGGVQEMKVHLDANASITWQNGRARRKQEDSKDDVLRLSFESEVNLSRLFPHRHEKELTITLTCTFFNLSVYLLVPDTRIYLNEVFELKIFVYNGSTKERDLVIRKPLAALSKGSIPIKFQNEPFISTEAMLDAYYTKYENLTTTFLPLAPEVQVGYNYRMVYAKKFRLLYPGRCSAVYMKFLPIREGLHWIRQIQVIDRLSGDTFDLQQVLEIRVETRVNL